MSDISDIHDALMDARRAVDSLGTWVRNADGRDAVRSYSRTIERGVAALELLQRDLRDGRKHVEPPDDYKHTSCYCSAPTCSPPCSWRTDPARADDEEN